MNTIVFDKLGGAVLFEDRSVPERERGGRPYGGVLDSPHVRPEMGIPDGPPLKDNLGLRHRRTGIKGNRRDLEENQGSGVAITPCFTSAVQWATFPLTTGNGKA
ncbi:Homeobox protein Mohawk [Pteropus alecto]|uniref:Homeobox protein Mohawk n=1 Tax=Pteropus alecto TaxID=9402 RepID=L5JUR9_PTEAL|nr:Homeobox protein Mohawk [Pteropus alecto]